MKPQKSSLKSWLRGLFILPALMTGTAFAQTDISASSEESAVNWDAVLTVDSLHNTKGGLKTGNRVTSNLDLSVSYVGENGFEAFGYIIADTGGGFSSTFSGDAQGVTNIDAPETIRLLEAWVKKTNASQTISVTFGAINLNSVFDANDNGGIFLNASHGMGPELASSGPSAFPLTSIGMIGEFTFSDTQKLAIGVFDGVPGDPENENAFAPFKFNKGDGAHWIVEYQQQIKDISFKIGHWQQTEKAERIDGLGLDKNAGSYALVGARLSRENTDDDQGLTGFVRLGVSNEDVAEIDHYVGLGLSYQGPFKGRNNDSLGLAVAQARFGAPARAASGLGMGPETNIELTYQAQIKPGIIIQPDVQYIKNPGGDKDAKSAVVVGIRLRLALEAFQ
jgi:porin